MVFYHVQLGPLLITYLQDRLCSLVASADPLELHKSLQDKAKQHLPHSNDLMREKKWNHIKKADSDINDNVQ